MRKMSSKQIISAAFIASVVGLSSAPLSAGAMSGDSNWSNNNNNSRDRDDRRDNERRNVSEWQARRIAQQVFPRKHIVRVDLRSDNGRREYQVRFADGSRVDVRVRDGQITYVDNNSRRYAFNDWR